MGAFDFNAMFKQAQEEGFSGTLLEPDTYDAEVVQAKVGQTQGKKDQVSVRFKVLSGPRQGDSAWLNITVPDATSKQGAVPAFFRKLGWFGLDQAFFSANPSLEQIASQIAQASPKRIRVSHRVYNGKTYADVEVIGEATGAASTPAPPAPPVPQAPPAAAPPAAPAPATDGGDSPEVAALKAQLAAAQAQAAPAPAPAAEAPAPAAPAADPSGPTIPGRGW